MSTDWILDSVLAFLSSPIWNEPVNNFIERNCTVFDPGEENKFSYTDIHKEYKKLIEVLLENFLDDLGIATKDFESACGSSHEAVQTAQEPEQGILKHILAADDFLLFKQMMVAKNAELDLQALRLIQQRQRQLQADNQANDGESAPRTTDTAPADGPAPGQTFEIDDEERLLEEILKQSQEEYLKISQEVEAAEQEELKKVLKMSEEESQRPHAAVKKELDQLALTLQLSLREHEERLKQQVQEKAGAKVVELPKKTAKEANSKTATVAPTVRATVSKTREPTQAVAADGPAQQKGTPAGDKSQMQKPIGHAAAVHPQQDDFWQRAAQAPITQSSTASRMGHVQGQQATPEELQERQDYLRRQRDRLLRLKEAQRKKHLQNFMETPKAAEQVNSARAAQAVIEGSEQPRGRDITDEEKLKVRFALATCLKREVIDAKRDTE